MNELVHISHKWKEIGRHLGVTGLEVVECNHPRDAVRCLEAVLKRWLSNDEESSWGKLAGALEAAQEEPKNFNNRCALSDFYFMKFCPMLFVLLSIPFVKCVGFGHAHHSTAVR
ncbi:hypothetical protein EMCRGX_G015738 [Ephydatia muelleri]